jgi:hypothetical protein
MNHKFIPIIIVGVGVFITVISVVMYFVLRGKPTITPTPPTPPTGKKGETTPKEVSTIEGVTVPITFIQSGSDYLPSIKISTGGSGPVAYILDTGSAQLTTTSGPTNGPEVSISYQGNSGNTVSASGYVQPPTQVNIGNGQGNSRVIVSEGLQPPLFGVATYGLLNMVSQQNLADNHKINNEVPPILSLLPEGSRRLRFDFPNGELTFGAGETSTQNVPVPMVGRFRFLIKCSSSMKNGPANVMIDTGTPGYYQSKSGPSLEGSTLMFGGKTVTLGSASGSMSLKQYENILLPDVSDKSFVILGIQYLKDFDFTIDIDNSQIYFD